MVRTVFYAVGTEAVARVFCGIFNLNLQKNTVALPNNVWHSHQPNRHLQDIPLQSFYSFQQHYQRVRLVILHHCGSDIYMCNQQWQAAKNEGRLAY